MTRQPPAGGSIVTAAPEQVLGRILDLDGHVMLGPEVLDGLLGPACGEDLLRWIGALTEHIEADAREAARQRALDDPRQVRGWLALGADDPADRLLALDRLGVRRQLLLPPVAWPTLDDDRPEAAESRWRYNSHVAAWAGGSDRLVPVAMLAMRDPVEAVTDAERIAELGFRAVEVPFAAPPGGLSPGDSAWDPLWACLAGAGIAAVLHLGGAGVGAAVPPPRSFLDPGWRQAQRLDPGPYPQSLATVRANAMGIPVSLATLHLPAETFCSSLILAGGLDRHPDLRVVVLEMGAQWVSSWVERLDAIADSYPTFGLPPLASRPSEAIRRQLRVTPFERNDVATWVERDGLAEVYAFASDYPHAEGGRDPAATFGRNLARLGPGAIERFFVANAAEVLGP